MFFLEVGWTEVLKSRITLIYEGNEDEILSGFSPLKSSGYNSVY